MGKGDIKQERLNYLSFNFNRTALFFICLIFPCPFWEAGKGLGGTDFIFTQKKSTGEVALQEIRVRES